MRRSVSTLVIAAILAALANAARGRRAERRAEMTATGEETIGGASS